MEDVVFEYLNNVEIIRYIPGLSKIFWPGPGFIVGDLEIPSCS